MIVLSVFCREYGRARGDLSDERDRNRSTTAGQFPRAIFPWIVSKVSFPLQGLEVFNQAPRRRDTESFAYFPHGGRVFLQGLEFLDEAEDFLLSFR